MNSQNLSNKELYALCKEYGKNARKWSRKFGFLLPEVARRHLYRRYRCTSIFEFAAKLAGMSRDITSRILNLSEKLKDKPLVWDSFEYFGWTKLEIVARAVTAENQKFWIDKLQKLPSSALIEYVEKWLINNKNSENCSERATLFGFENGAIMVSGLNKPEINGAPGFTEEFTDQFRGQLRGEAEQQSGSTEYDYVESGAATSFAGRGDFLSKSFKKLKFRVDTETEFEFKRFKQAMEKEKKEVLTMGETLKLLLKKVKELKKTKSEKTANGDYSTGSEQTQFGSDSTHYGKSRNRIGPDSSSNLSGLHHKHAKSDKTASSERSHHQSGKHRQDRHQIKLIATAIRDKTISLIKKSGPVTRKIPQKIQKSIIAAYNSKCAFSGCNEPYCELHHPDRFSLNKSHQRIYPLCRLHHQLAHAGMIKNEELTIENWEIDFEKKAVAVENVFSLYKIIEKQKIDQIVRDHWQT